MTASFAIGNRLIGAGQPAFIIAEAGANHNGDLAMAKKMCLIARDIGCDCIKIRINHSTPISACIINMCGHMG